MPKYDDIINMPYPRRDWNLEKLHPRMNLRDRAKIFSPFAALKGFEESIEKEAAKTNSQMPHLEASED